jgi:hypothetical protein
MKFDAIRVQKEIEHYRSETAYRFAFKATERFSTALLAKSNSSDGNWWIQLSPCEYVRRAKRMQSLKWDGIGAVDNKALEPDAVVQEITDMEMTMDLQTYLETQPMKRHTQPHDRYQITDSCCGLVATRTSLAKASEAAKIHAERHGSEGDNTVTVVEVFDTMARRDCMDTWKFPVSNAQSAT